MRDDALATQYVVGAYKSLIKIPTEQMTAAQQAHLLETEQHLIKALMNLPRNRLERAAIRRFIERMMKRETDAGL